MRLRLILSGLLLALSLGVECQAGEVSAPFSPDIFVVVREHQTTADLVTVTVRKDGYSAELLREQCLRIGENTGSGIRGLEISETEMGTPGGLKLLRAFFAVDGVIDRASGGLDLQSVVRAFAGVVGDQQVNGIQIALDGEVPTERTLNQLDNESVKISARVVQNPTGLEYRVILKTQEAEAIEIPKLVEPPKETTPETVPAKKSVDFVVVGLIGCASIAGGALVYSLLLRLKSPR